ncbi:MAG: GntR family transcriptional regulator, partial [bacterium]
ARLAATRGGNGLKAALTENVGLQSVAVTYRELTRRDVAFHELIVRAAGNDRLLAAWLTVRSVFEFWLAAAFRDTDLAVEPRELAVKSHRRLLAAVTSGDPSRAEKAAIAHITSWRSYLHYARPASEGTTS